MAAISTTAELLTLQLPDYADVDESQLLDSLWHTDFHTIETALSNSSMMSVYHDTDPVNTSLSSLTIIDGPTLPTASPTNSNTARYEHHTSTSGLCNVDEMDNDSLRDGAALSPLRCPQCSKSFPVKRSLVRHLRTVSCRGQPVPSRHQCAICNAKFPRKDDYARHERFQHEAGKVKCSMCAYEVAARSLPEHRKTKRCLKAASETMARTVVKKPADATASTLSPMSHPADTWKLFDPWQLLWKVFIYDKITLEVERLPGSSVERRSLLIRFVSKEWKEACLQQRYNVAPWNMKATLLQVVASKVTEETAYRDLYPWLQCLVVFAGILGELEEMVTHFHYSERMYDRLSGSQAAQLS